MKVAVITSRFPFPVEKGDKLRAYRHIRHLSRTYDVHLFALSHIAVGQEAVEELDRYCRSIQIFRLKRWKLPLNVLQGLLNDLPMQVSYFLDMQQKRRLQHALIQLRPDHIYTQLIRTAEYVRNLPFDKTLDYMDTFSYGARQRARSGLFIFRPFFSFEHRLLRSYERAVYPDFNAHTVISEQDRDRLPLAYQKSVTILPNGVDTRFFAPESRDEIYDVAFVGNMGYHPNVEAAEYLVRRVMPHVWKEIPKARVCIAGARPHRRVKRLAGRRVEITGWVEDIRKYYSEAKLFVAPMRSGMGLQNKLLEAMAMGRASVTTSIVNNAIGATPGNHLEVADDTVEIARRIVQLLRDDECRKSLGVAARQFAEDHYGWNAQNKILDELIYSHSRTYRKQIHGSTDRRREGHLEFNP